MPGRGRRSGPPSGRRKRPAGLGCSDREKGKKEEMGWAERKRGRKVRVWVLLKEKGRGGLLNHMRGETK
jgi:hypothetical protein